MASQQPEHSEADEVPVDALSCRLGLKCFPTRIATSMAATAYVSQVTSPRAMTVVREPGRHTRIQRKSPRARDPCDLGCTLGYSGSHPELVILAILEAHAPPFQTGQKHAVRCTAGRLRSDVTGHRRERRNSSGFWGGGLRSSPAAP